MLTGGLVLLLQVLVTDVSELSGLLFWYPAVIRDHLGPVLITPCCVSHAWRCVAGASWLSPGLSAVWVMVGGVPLCMHLFCVYIYIYIGRSGLPVAADMWFLDQVAVACRKDPW